MDVKDPIFLSGVDKCLKPVIYNLSRVLRTKGIKYLERAYLGGKEALGVSLYSLESLRRKMNHQRYLKEIGKSVGLRGFELLFDVREGVGEFYLILDEGYFELPTKSVDDYLVVEGLKVCRVSKLESIDKKLKEMRLKEYGGVFSIEMVFDDWEYWNMVTDESNPVYNSRKLSVRVHNPKGLKWYSANKAF